MMMRARSWKLLGPDELVARRLVLGFWSGGMKEKMRKGIRSEGNEVRDVRITAWLRGG